MLDLRKRSKKNFFFEIFIVIVFSIIIVSFKSTFVEALSDNGQADFQLYPAKCALQGINHYNSYINRDGECSFFMAQYGEYAQGFYILVLPLTFLEWDKAKTIWFALNIILTFFLIFFLCKKFKINKIYTFLIIFLVFSSIVTKASLIMGQQAIFTLFFLALPFIFNSRLSHFLSGISYFKYNIGYGLFIFYLISKKYKILFYSLIPCFFGWIIYCLITNSNFIENLFQPIQLSIKNLSTINQFFLFSFLKEIMNLSEPVQYLLMFLPSILLNLFFIKKISSLKNDLQKLSSLCILVLISIPHYPHDYVLVIPLLIYAIKSYSVNIFISRINFFGAIYFLNFYRAVEIYFEKFLLFLNFEINFVKATVLIISYTNIFFLFLILILNCDILKKNT
jgi:hypothetical protein